MTNELEFPVMKAGSSVLTKLGINSDIRVDPREQDLEYTSCSMDELDEYLVLYNTPAISDPEKRVLGCYLMEGQTTTFLSKSANTPCTILIMDIFHRDYRIHHYEIQYRLKKSGDDPETWWPIGIYRLERWGT